MLKHVLPGAGYLKRWAARNSDQQRAAEHDDENEGDHGPVARERKAFRMSDFQMKDTLGTGTFSRVRLARHIMSESFYAIKILKKVEILRLKQLEHTKDEISLLLKIEHPFIIGLHGYFHDESRIFMVLDFVAGGEVLKLLRSGKSRDLGRFTDDDAKFYLSELFLAIKHLHKMNVVYRDIKPENLLINAQGHVCLTDFGFAKVVVDRTFTICGTPEYLAPEVITGLGYGKSGDWWAFGILAYEMVVGYPPFYGDTPFGIYQRILDGEFLLDRSMNIKYQCENIIKKLLIQDRTKRLGSRKGSIEIEKHKYFHLVNWETTYAMQTKPPWQPELKGPGDSSWFDNYPDSEDDFAVALEGQEQQQFKIFDDL